MLRLLLAALLLAGCSGPAERVVEAAGSEWELVFAEDFASPAALSRFVFSDGDGWCWSDEGGVPSLELAASNDYAPPHRSPLAIALVRGQRFGDFDLEVDALQTGREYGHRDLCLFLAFESPARFHYVHLATTPDQNAHNIFLVDDAPRRNLLVPQATGMDWGDGWHRLRLERRVAAGTIRVFVDGASEPILAVADTTLGAGSVGLGSFDDTGRFARLRIWAPALLSDDSPPFAR